MNTHNTAGWWARSVNALPMARTQASALAATRPAPAQHALARAGRAAAAALALAMLATPWAAQAQVQTVCSTGAAIAIPASGTLAGPASPYPSTITVSGFAGTTGKLTVDLKGLSHTWPSDIDMLLVGPTGQSVVLMSDAGESFSLNAVDLTLDDAAATALPAAQITSGSYKPTDFAGIATDTYVSAPAGPYGSTLAGFNGLNPDGSWKLFIVDDAGGDVGSLNQWCLNLTPTLVISSSSLPSGTVDTAYAQTLSATNISGSSLSWSASGTLPPGLSLSSSTGDLSGTPTTAGSYSFDVSVSDGSLSSTQSFTVVVAFGAPTAPTLSATAGPTQAQLSIAEPASTGGSPVASYALSCPPSATITVAAAGNPTAYTLTGLTNNTTYSCTATATNGAGLISPASAAITVTPRAGLTDTSNLPAATLGQAYTATLSASGGLGSYSWSNVTGLPAGLGYASGAITGTPTQSGSFPVAATLSDSGSAQTVPVAWTLTVNPATLAFVPPSTVPAATVGQPYSLQLSATGGTAPYTWSATGLPAGLAIDNTGLISGTPTDTKSAALTTKAVLAATITLTDSMAVQATQTLSLTVNAAAVTSTPTGNATPVPTLHHAALVLLSLMAAGFGALAMRSRKMGGV